MTTISIADGALHVTFTRGEKIAGLVGDQRVPLEAVRRVTVVPDGVAATRGLRAPGLGIPGRRHIGTWRGRSLTLVSVRGGRPALSIELEGHRYDRMLLAVADPDATAASIAARTGA